MNLVRFDFGQCFVGLILGLFIVAVLMPSFLFTHVSAVDGWWDIDWGYRKKIVFNNSAINEDLQNFPMPIVFDSAESGFWDHVKDDGSDIRFVDADGTTELYFELERWQSETNEITANGAYQWFCKPSAVYYGGTHNRTYFSWVTDDDPCEVQIRYYDHDGHNFSDIVTLHTHSGRDDHGAPSLLVIPSGSNQGKLLVFYNYHGSTLYCRRSSNPEDISSWDSEVTIESDKTSYPKPVILQNGTIIVYYRYEGGSNRVESYRTTDDDGDTWSGRNDIIDMGSGTSPYTFVAYADVGSETEIHLAWSVWNSSADERVEDLFYIYSNDSANTWMTRGGTIRTPPIDHTEADSVYNTPSDYGTWAWDLKLDSAYDPFIVATDENNRPNGKVIWAYHNGTDWIVRDTGLQTARIDTYSSDGGTYYHDYQSGVIIDNSDPSRIYVATNETSSYCEIQEWYTTDNGVSWINSQNMTSNSSKDNWRPQYVKDHVSGNAFEVVWEVNNDYTHYTNYDTFLEGHPGATLYDMVAWVNVPRVDSGSSTDSIWIYYGNEGAGFDGYCNSSQVWTNDYVAVWHLNETSGTLYDATSNNNDGTRRGGGEPAYTSSGLVDGAQTWDGNNDYVQVSDSASLDITDGTFEAWVHLDNYDSSWVSGIISKTSYDDTDAGYAFSIAGCEDSSHVGKMRLWQTDDTKINGYSNTAVGTGGWKYCVASFIDGTTYFYLNGISDGYTTGQPQTDFGSSTEDLAIGGDNRDWNDYVPQGKLDEIRISSASHSAEWIEACYQYQVDQTKLQYGSEETFQATKLYINPPLVEKSYLDICTTFSVNVTIENVTDLYAFDFNLTWDNTLITLVDVEFNTTLDSLWGSGSWFLAQNKTRPGYYELAAVSISTGFNTIQPVAMAILTFHVEDAASGQTPLHFSLVKLGNSKWQSIPVEATDGLYTLTFETRLYIDPPLVQKDPGDVCTNWEANVTIENVMDLFGFDFNLTWNPNLIRLVRVEYNSTLDDVWGKGNWMAVKNQSGSGWYKLVALSTSAGFNTSDSQALVELTFHVESCWNWQAETALNFTVAKLSDSEWQPISAAIEDGTYRITGPKPTLKMSPSSVTCRKYCENFTITVNASDIYNLRDFKFEIHYNTTLLDYVNVTWNAWGSGNMTVDGAIGNITGCTSGLLKTGNLTLITITFHASHHHIWKDCPDWTNNLTGTINIQWANFSYPDAPDLRYDKGGLNDINVLPLDVIYNFIPIQGDVDSDGDVDIFDLRTVAAYYDKPQPTEYDLNCDGTIDIYDLVKLAENYCFKYP